MYNDHDYDSNINWNGSTYSTGSYRVEDNGPADSAGASGPTGPVGPEEHKQHRKMSSGSKKVVAVALACALIGGGSGVGGAAVYNALNNAKSSTTVYQSTAGTNVNVSTVADGEKMSLTQIYDKYLDACVSITCTVPYTNGWYQTTATSAGSGFVITDDGYIVTNYHVISGATAITVTMANGDTYTAKLVGGEEANDVAVLKIEATGLTAVVLGDSDSLQVGETVCTIGNALGTLSFSQTSGAVSAVNRAITMEDGSILNMIQTDCTINSGNSGGPLFDEYGHVVGITSAKYSGTTSSSASIEGIGFAIPINDVNDIIKDIMQYGYVTGKPYMGITVATVDESISQQLNIPEGAYVNTVESGSCAEKAGLKTGDVITAIDDTKVTSSAELIAAKNTYKAGDTAKLTVVRSGETLTLSITFDEDTNSASSSSSGSSGSSDSSGSNGSTDNGSNGYSYGFGSDGSGNSGSSDGSSGNSIFPFGY